MPEQPRERAAASDQGGRTAQPRSARAAGAASRPSDHSPGDRQRRDLATRAGRYLAAPGDGDARRLRTEIDRNPDVRLLRLIEPATPAFPALAVIEGAARDAGLLGDRTGALIEPDLPLRYGAPSGYTVGDPTSLPISSETAFETIVVEVRDETGQPVAEAAVHVIDHDYPACAVTGREGRAELRIPSAVCLSAAALIVQPPRGHWSTQVLDPALSATAPNPVTCPRLGSGRHEGAPRPVMDWPRHVLGLDHLAVGPLGSGTRVALIDSGADLDHPDLADANVTGYDLIERDEKSWRTDLLGVGTATASLLVGAGVYDEDGPGVTGVCRDAELHVLKVAPGGHISDLIEALDYCIDHGIDVAAVCVVAPGASTFLTAKVAQTLAAGVCVIAAAGDQPDTVGHPAALPGVLAVGALGQVGAFPPDSHHAARVTTPPGPDGFFIAGCTPGPTLVDLYGPGVAIPGAAPGGGYVARDGTAPATAQAAGIAALIAAHHPTLRERSVRGMTRSQLLAHLLLATARPIQTGGPGDAVPVPDGAQAVGALSAASTAPPTRPGTAGAATAHMFTRTHL